MLPVDLGTIYGATLIRYRSDDCVVNVYLRIAHVSGMRDHGTPQIFSSSSLGSGRSQRFPQGTVHISERNGRQLAAWLGPHLVVVDAHELGPDENALIEALLAEFPSGTP